MANVLLGVTGSVAAVRTPQVYDALCAAGHAVRIAATQASLYFFDPAGISPIVGGRNREVVHLDADEWPDREAGGRYARGDDVLHIELRKWADLLLIAPLDANTLAKLAGGLSDNLLTCVYRAWDFTRPVVLAPAMNTLMWDSPLTRRHLRTLIADHGGAQPSANESADSSLLAGAVNRLCRRLRIVAPVSKTLACGDVGVGAMASPEDIAAAVNEALG